MVPRIPGRVSWTDTLLQCAHYKATPCRQRGAEADPTHGGRSVSWHARLQS